VPYIDDYYTFKSSYGAHVYIHNKSRVPNWNEGIDVSVNERTDIVIRRQFSSTLPSPYGNCIKKTSSFGSIFTNMFAKNNLTYSQSDCFE
jgi:hypothetical protein